MLFFGFIDVFKLAANSRGPGRKAKHHKEHAEQPADWLPHTLPKAICGNAQLRQTRTITVETNDKPSKRILGVASCDFRGGNSKTCGRCADSDQLKSVIRNHRRLVQRSMAVTRLPIMFRT